MRIPPPPFWLWAFAVFGFTVGMLLQLSLEFHK